ncbi:uncharacterized protein B0T15DRAFT_536539 [Chaetomium strumarium]|uniref:Uncharacterized protein n=1 Tax=Chaetomium strumarium TaxID=1170767 RepID=A0AAJ0M0K7_9PEZI|nr:hypothetical protein B0T15DRAFT_536539 [Chaetomium strumarium]
MSTQSKAITIGLVLAFGIGNAYYSFNPSLRELKEQRDGPTTSKAPGTQRLSAPQLEPDRQQKSS